MPQVTIVLPTAREELEAAAHGSVELAKRSLRAFLPHVRIMEPGKGETAYQLWPHLVKTADLLQRERLVLVLKARKIGLSWLLAAEDLWIAQFSGPTTVLLYSQGEREAQEKLERVRFIRDHLMAPLQVPVLSSNQEELRLANGSSLLALPSTSKAGRSYAGTHVDMDEADFFQDLGGSYNAVKPMIDDNKGRLRLTSTANPYSGESLFKTLYREAGNGFKRVFYPWSVRPDRDAAWRARVMSEYADQALAAKEYPNSAEEALAPAQALMAFTLEALEAMQQDVREPVERLGLAAIYQRPVPGKRYAAGTDTSHGVGRDKAVTVILDCQTGYVAADIQSPVLGPSDLAVESCKLLALYWNPIWGIEDNDWGHETIRVAQDMRYPRLYARPGRVGPHGEPAVGPVGWHTDAVTHYTMWGDLVEAVSDRLIVVPSREGLAELYGIIRDPENRGKIEAMRGRHDDYGTALAIAWQVRGYAVSAGPVQTGSAHRRARREAVKRW